MILFNKFHWFDIEQNQPKQLLAEVASLDGDRLLNTPVEDLCNYFESKYRVDVPTLRADEIVVDQHDTQIDVSGDRRRFIRNREEPFYLQGATIEVEVPFEGDAEVFGIQPTTFTLKSIEAEVLNNRIRFRIEGIDLQSAEVRSHVDGTIAHIQESLASLRENANGLNNRLRPIAQEAIEARRKKLLASRSLVESLGFKIKHRENAPRTYAVPEIRRKISPTLPPSSQVPYKPEPVLKDVDYEHILSVIQNMTHVMERSPSTFLSMDEETIRTHFLVQLNGHYEGQATGETFNYEGKTDILIRSGGKNLFIAECKFWGGPKKLIETLDQLLGYSSWRDTKVAVIIFNRNKDFSKVLEAIRETVKTHPNFKRELGHKSETCFQYVFSHKNDASREMTLTVMAFDIPTSTAQ